MNSIVSKATAAVLVCSVIAAAAERRPNVLLIISDDQGWTDFGFMGQETVKTPNLDRLAASGAVFPYAYVTAPLCRPSLASIMTGRYGFQTRICCNNAPNGVDRTVTHAHIKNLPTLPRLLGKAGYRSLQTGKFWEGDFANAGFTDGATEESSRHGSRASLAIGREGLKPIDDFLDACGETPWLVWYAPMMPHEPHTPPDRILNKYLAPDRPVRLSKYWAMCEWFDETCGQLLDDLARRKMLDDTLVVFITDNGWIQGTGTNRQTRGSFAPKSKLSPYDGGLRTPVILRWPGHIKAGRRNELASAIDLAPTILLACGVEPAEAMKGANLLDVLAGKADLRDRPVFSEVYDHTEVVLNDPAASLTHRVVHLGDWSLILPVRDKPELYNTTGDPKQERNLAADQPERVTALTRLLDDWWNPAPTSRPNK